MKEEDVTGMREFAPSLLEPFGLRAKRVTRAYGAFICETAQGLKIVKKTTASVGEIWFAHGVKEHLARAGFGETDRFRLTSEGEPFAMVGPDCYTVRDWGIGEEPNIQEPAQVVQIAEELGRMARRSEGYSSPEGSRSIKRYHEMPEQLHKQLQKLERYGKNLRRSGRYTEFDLTLLECLPLHIEQAREAEKMILDPKFTGEAERAEKEAVAAHNNFSNHTVLRGPERMLITDFENACYGMPIFDLAGFLEKVLRKNHWEQRLGIRLTEVYDRVCPLNSIQRQILYAKILFPGRLVELCNEVYNVRRNWTPLAYGQKLSEIRAQQEERRDFLEYFRKHCL